MERRQFLGTYWDAYNKVANNYARHIINYRNVLWRMLTSFLLSVRGILYYSIDQRSVL